jgi:hypothetical protein
MNDLLADAWAKYRRADTHADALHREIGIHRDRNVTKIVHEPDRESGDYIFRAQVSEEPPLREWGLTVGDILHNLHSALDAVAWQLVLAHNGGAEPSDNVARSIYFPLARTPDTFPSFTVLKHVTQIHRDLLSDVQPYRPGYEPLLTLAALSKLDKHRAIHPTYLLPDNFRLRVEAVRDCEILRVIHAPPGPLVDGRELARVQGRTTGPDPTLEGRANLRGRVCLGDGTPLQKLFDEIGVAVREVLRTFDPKIISA